MRQAAYESMMRLHANYGPREFGKLCQKLLAITYRRAGFAHIVERGVQGVDVDAGDGQVKYTTEVKTTIKHAIMFEPKDVEGLKARKCDGYHPLLAALRLSPLEDWLLADADHLGPGLLSLERLRAYRRRDLEERLCPLFAIVLEEHGDGTLRGAQAYLDSVLRNAGIEQRDQ